MKPLHALIIALAAQMALTSCLDRHSKGEDAPGMAMNVDVAHPITDSLTLRKSFPAYLSAGKEVDVVARVDGFITAKLYKDGQRVTRGQALFTIDDTQYRNAVSQAEASLATAHAQAEYASRQYEAMKKALESDAVSQMDVIQAESARNEGIASVKNAEAALSTARTNLGYCTVRALSDGHITASTLDVGAYVGGAAQPVRLATIYDDSHLSAITSITDSRYIDMMSSASAKLDFDNIPLAMNEPLPHSYCGKLDYVAPDIDTSTGTMTIRVKVENPYGELREGMYCQVMLPIADEPHAILVKDASISTDQRGKYLYTVNDSNRVVYTPITVGQLYHDTLRVVLSGVTPSSLYVTKALLKVRNGMKVKPIVTK